MNYEKDTDFEMLKQMITFFEKQGKMHEIESRRAKEMHSMGLLGNNDIVWTIGAGPLGIETAAYGEYAGMSIGIDPLFLKPDMMADNCFFLENTIEDVLTYDNVPKPTIVIFNSYSGIHSVLGDILELETEPTCILSPCGCKNCVDRYYRNDGPKNNSFQKQFGKASYIDIDPEDPAKLDVVDMSLSAQDAGYLSQIIGESSKDLTMYLLVISKKKEMIDYFRSSAQ